MKPSSDVVLDCQVGINSPVTEESTVIGPHLDNCVEIYAGMFYLRTEDDDSSGGTLEIYKPRSALGDFFLGGNRLRPKILIDHAILDKADEVPYGPNTFVLFMCTYHSIHGVSPRNVTPHSRRLVNIIAEDARSMSNWL